MAPPVFDTSVPDVTRVQACLSGGKDTYEADREQAARLLAADPEIGKRAAEHLQFLAAAVKRAALEGGIGQFLYLRCGFPRPGRDLHDWAREVSPGARVAYADTDPVVVSHARALLRGPGLAASGADPLDPAAVWDDPDVLSVINPGEPVGVVFGAIANFHPAGMVREACAGHMAHAAPGSWLVASAVCYRDEALYREVLAASSGSRFRSVTADEFASFFAGLELVAPDVTCIQRWMRRMAGPPLRRPAFMLAGAGVRP